MISFTNTIAISKPLHEVFVFVSTFEHIPMWNYYVHSVVPTGAKRSTVGAQYHQVRKDDEQHFEVVAFGEDSHFRIQTLPGSKLQFDRTMEFSTECGQTYIKDQFAVSTAYPAVMEHLFRAKIKNAVSENLNHLKTLLETGSTTLQNGRQVQLH
ncbi:SRPBCC family protein [Marinoscillum furvescens]|uniref:Polyketide cyclase/dehydrase/lipid transport protein n=1 Tax=Marinoscillum furvescens DSM 4134 TaxID=1122208 RepID=A0A3D9KXC2_MARFU|nr:SRPBCC family protein [Marinoscillum furvescens]RED93033.1 hypothetical protein C7460_12757 [Marinoscillum furvescens DSM 4134]